MHGHEPTQTENTRTHQGEHVQGRRHKNPRWVCALIGRSPTSIGVWCLFLLPGGLAMGLPIKEKRHMNSIRVCRWFRLLDRGCLKPSPLQPHLARHPRNLARAGRAPSATWPTTWSSGCAGHHRGHVVVGTGSTERKQRKWRGMLYQ